MKSCKKVAKKYHCKKCDYTCSNKYNFNKHLSTTKHKMITNGNSNGNSKPNFVEFSCENCGKSYRYKSGLSRHRKGCVEMNQSLVLKISDSKVAKANLEVTNQEMIEKLTETIKQQGDLIEKLIDHQKEIIPKIGNNNNNKISINVFLNEHCKSAMNLGDFVENVKITLDDLLYTKDNGYVKGISNIFVKHLTDMKPTERPIVCSDKKRLQFYVKEEDIWQKDKEHTKLNKSIQNVSIKQIKKLKEWEALHPDYLTDEHLMCQWHQMIQEIMGGASNAERERNTENIKKGILETVDMKKALVQ